MKQGATRKRLYQALKRCFDISIALVLLLLLSPVLAIVALAVRWQLGSPVLFRQRRPGRHGKPFTILKFRTMHEHRGPDGNDLADAERLSLFGHFLRRSSLDELPELLNVLRGEMSLVGPRPLLVEYLPLYSVEQARRHEVLPGVTGWAQVHGRNALSWQERLAHDVWYVDHRSLALDIWILVMTARSVVLREGISGAGHVTMAKFQGPADLQ